jgi:type IV secretory pathway VirB10-like protein
MSDPTAPRADASGVASVITHRLTPPGVLPRRGQVWLMVGVAGGILAIILFTGNHDPAPPRTSAASSPAALAPNPEQLRTYQRRLEAADTRPQAPPISLQDLRPSPRPADDGGLRDQGSTRAQDPIAEERRRREYESLFANNVVQSPTLATTEPTRSASPRRSTPGMNGDLGAAPPSLDDVAEAVVRASTARTNTTSASTTVAPTTSAPSPAPVLAPEYTAADGPLNRILEGTIIDTILTNRLDGAAAAPVNCLVSTPIYSTDQQVLIPAGARLLGTTKPVQSFGETRLAVGFTRIVMPNGRTYSLDHFMGLNGIGDAGLRDQVNQHYASTFGVSAAVGLISGFAQYLGGGFVNRNSGPIIITGNVGDATAQAATQTMSRFLNRLPTITVREGHRVKVYLTSDLQLPVYQATRPDRGLRVAGRVQP